MNAATGKPHAAIIPTMRYRNAAQAIDWLCDAFGFERHFVVDGEDGKIAHAQLTWRDGMIMLGDEKHGEFDKLVIHPLDHGKRQTQSPYILVDDVDAHCARARAAGAEIVMEPEDQDYGGRFYSCRDPEGYLWNFGSYDPWAE